MATRDQFDETRGASPHCQGNDKLARFVVRREAEDIENYRNASSTELKEWVLSLESVESLNERMSFLLFIDS